MNIIGSRIFLRAIELEDSEMLMEIINDETIERELGGWSFPVSEINQHDWIKSLKPNEHILRCIIVVADTAQTIGTVMLTNIDYKNGNAEIHIKIRKSCFGKGYGTETIKLVSNYGFEELRLNCIYSHVNSSNKISQKLFEKCGFSKEGVLRARIFKQGEFDNVCVYSILKGEFYGNR